MNHRWRRYATLIAALLALSACQMDRRSLNHTVDELLFKGGETFNMLNAYAVIRRDFKRGRIMRARARALALDPTDHDYEKVRKLLDEQIEPARRRMFLHYLRMAKKQEAEQRWSDALWSYDQARAVTIKPAVMERKRREMEQRMRQLRLEKLLQQRRKEDRALFADASAYEPPVGISKQDEIYARMREHFEDRLDTRARLAFREAQRYLSKGVPEIAYIELESYMRLQPGRVKADKLMQHIRRAMPAFIKIPPERSRMQGASKSTVIKRVSHVRQVTPRQITAALKTGELLQARELAHIYQRNGGQDADKLMNRVRKQLRSEAARLFARGSAAFRHEQLDRAIAYWNDAAALAPEVSEYVESLRRARQLQERLKLLKEAK